MKRAASIAASIAIGLFGLAATPARAGDFIAPGPETIYISHSADGDGSSCLSPDFGVSGGDSSDEFEDAINGAPNYSTIFVCAGTYYMLSNPEILLNGRTLKIVGDDESTTHLDGNGSDRVLNFYNGIGGTVYLRSLHFTNGGGDGGWGAGAVFGDVVNFDIAFCVFDHNDADNLWGAGLGGGLWVEGGSAKIDHTRFEDNFAHAAGAIYAINTTFVEIVASEFVGNVSETHSGAIGIYNSTYFTVRNSIFTGNRAVAQYGGAIHTQNMYSVKIAANTFIDNRAGENGGAVDLCSTTYASILNSNFNSNRANLAGGAIGIYCGGDTKFLIQGNRFVKNDSTTIGGAILSNAVNLSLGANLFDRNTSSVGGGVALMNSDSWTRAEMAALGGNTYLRNYADFGGAIWIDCPASATMLGLLRSGSKFSGNTAWFPWTKEIGTDCF